MLLNETWPEVVVLTYYNTRGKAELARCILSAARVPFRDRRIDLAEVESILKESKYLEEARREKDLTLYADSDQEFSLPVLELPQGEKIFGGLRIAKFLTERFAKDEKAEEAEILMDYIAKYFERKKSFS